ncbi:hypothetical protein V1517DRAFT_306810 [Lipomyces orientalis]|uniref:Uncharacterized protein n=1 Tax=Lipomyces orientalis TaxID=1233043 RepID=A0ACC3TR45_9ASCO
MSGTIETIDLRPSSRIRLTHPVDYVLEANGTYVAMYNVGSRYVIDAALISYGIYSAPWDLVGWCGDNGLPLSARILSGVNPRDFNSPIVSLNSSLSEGIIDVINGETVNISLELKRQYINELERLETIVTQDITALPVSKEELSAYLLISRNVLSTALSLPSN